MGVQVYGPVGQQEGADTLADTIDWVLTDIADASQRQPAEDPRYVRGPEHMILNAAYLLRGDRAPSSWRPRTRWPGPGPGCGPT